MITSETEVMQPLLDLVWAHLLPAFSGPGGDDDRLAERLADPGLPVDGAGTVRRGRLGDRSRRRAGRRRASGWSLTLTDAGQTLVVGCGDGQWQRTAVPVGTDRELVVEAQGGGRIPTPSSPSWFSSRARTG